MSILPRSAARGWHAIGDMDKNRSPARAGEASARNGVAHSIEANPSFAAVLASIEASPDGATRAMGGFRGEAQRLDLHVLAKLFEQRLERSEEAEALAGREIVAQHDLLQPGVAERVEVARQVAAQPPVRVLDRPLLPGRVRRTS